MVSQQDIYHVLLKEFPWFHKLDEGKRLRLCVRTKTFMLGTAFEGHAGFEITDRVRILISACSQLLTLGFPKHYHYAYFEKVLVYPAKYYSSHTQRYHVGEMNTAGVLVFSWEDFYKGISNGNDAHNVGLHEFAHALEYMDLSNKDIDPVFSACLDKLAALAAYYLHHQPQKPLFRRYATINLSEFFAVATEYYFEAPLEFARQEPEIFDLLRKAYRQDTAPAVILPAKKELAEDKKIFGAYRALTSVLIQGGGYSVSIAASALLSAYQPALACLMLLAGCFFTYRSTFSKKQFTLYRYHVEIHLPFFRRLLASLMPSLFGHQTTLAYAEVLYFSAGEYAAERSNTLFQQECEGFACTLCYWQKGRVCFAYQSVKGMDIEKLLCYLYLKKKVGARLNGEFKRYKEA